MPIIATINYSLSNDLYTTQSDEMMPRYPIVRSRSVNADRSRSRPAVVAQLSSYVRDSQGLKASLTYCKILIFL